MACFFHSYLSPDVPALLQQSWPETNVLESKARAQRILSLCISSYLTKVVFFKPYPRAVKSTAARTVRMKISRAPRNN